MMKKEGLYDKIVEGWERSETSNGIPYYINHNSSMTQWDHPWFVKTMEELNDLDNVRYAAYRTALKLRLLQKKFALNLVEIRTINVVFDRHGYRGHNSSLVSCHSLYDILLDLCNTSRLQNGAMANLNVETVAEMLYNWLQNLYDVNRTGHLRVLSVKIGLAALSSARLSEKYRYFFRELCDSTNHVSRKPMTSFLRDLIQIPEQISEAFPFGGVNVTPAVNNCFATAWSNIGITEDEFMSWLMKEPQTIVWLPTMHRLAAAEMVKHEAKCSVCKAFPIIGFRYRCLKCFNYDLCQLCFFTGRINKKHKLKHPTQEYCVNTTTKQDTKDFMKTVRNNISKKHRNKRKLRYLPIGGMDQPYAEEDSSGSMTQSPPYDRSQPGYDPQGYGDGPGDEDVEDAGDDSVPDPPSQNTQNLSPRRPNMSPESYNRMLKQLEVQNRRLLHELSHLQQTTPQYPNTPQYPSPQYPSPALYPPGSVMPLIRHAPLRGTPDAGPMTLDLGPLRLHSNNSRPESQSGSEGSELEYLRDEKDRLEAKQEVLESHNKQLELQLYRLRMLLSQDSSIEGGLADTSTPLLPASSTAPPPPYQATPTGNSLSQSMFMDHPTTQALVHKFRASTPEDDLRFEDDVRSDVEDTYEEEDTYEDVSKDPALGQTHFSLPSPDQSRCFPEEEAELAELLEKLNNVYPADVTHSILEQSQNELEAMYAAANKIGDAFTGFVGNLQEKEDLADSDSGECSDTEKGSHHNTTLEYKAGLADVSYDT